MKSILWFKLKNKNHLILTAVLLALTSLSLVIYVNMGMDKYKLISLLPITSIFLAFILTNDRDLFTEVETIFSTPLVVKDIWLVDTLLPVILGEIHSLIFSLLLIFLYKLDLSKTVISLFLNLSTSIFSLGVVAMSLSFYSDYSKISQYLSSFFSITFASLPFVLPLLAATINLKLYVALINIGLGLALVYFANRIIENSNRETLIINILKGDRQI